MYPNFLPYFVVVLRETVSQTKYCYSLEVKIFGLTQTFRLAAPLMTLKQTTPNVNMETEQKVHKR